MLRLLTCVYQEIIEADVLLALKLRDRGKIEKQVKLRQAQLEMNAVDLPSIPDNHLDISYPGPSVLMKRTYTLCSTEEAYPEVRIHDNISTDINIRRRSLSQILPIPLIGQMS